MVHIPIRSILQKEVIFLTENIFSFSVRIIQVLIINLNYTYEVFYTVLPVGEVIFNSVCQAV